MKDFEDIKRLWRVQSEQPIASYENLRQVILSKKNTYEKRLLVQFMGTVLATIGILFIWILVPFYTWAAHLSLLIVFFCVVYYMISQWKDYRLIKSAQYLNKPKEYILFLREYQARRYRFNTRNYRIYAGFILFSFVLFCVELSYYLSNYKLLNFITLSCIWFILCHQVFMRLYIRREQSKLQDMIEHLERLQSQFGD